MKVNKYKLLLGILLLAILFSLCKDSRTNSVSITGFAIGTVVSITIYSGGSNELLEGCMELCRDYELLFSATLEDSELSKLNKGLKAEGRAEAPEELLGLIARSLGYSELSGGAFDVTIGALSSLWDFGNPRIPESAVISDALRLVDYSQIKIEGSVIYAPPGTRIDLGAIAKGYIADRLKEYLLENGVGSAIINLGGNVHCVGRHANGENFKIGVRKPFGAYNETAALLMINGLSVVTSGSYERYFYENGTLYHHLLDPKTGYPSNSGLHSVTLISTSSEQCDALSTACFVLGMDMAIELINSIDGVYAMFINEQGVVSYSEGFEHMADIG